MNRASEFPKKILMITLDGGTLDVIKPLVKLGYMPTIKSLMETGSFGILNSAVPPVSAPAWASFMTGKNPGKHGVFEFRTYDPTTNRDYFVNSQSIRGKTIWDILSEKGRKVVVLNLPMTYPPYPVNGIMLSGFDTPSSISQFTYPEELKEEILSLCADYDFGPTYEEISDFEKYLAKNSAMVANVAKVALTLMKKSSWDVFMINFQNTDFIQHLLWGPLTEELEGVPSNGKRLDIMKLYKEIDTHINSLILAAGDKETIKIVFSDHGFGPSIGKIYINQFLMDWNLLSFSMAGSERVNEISKVKKILMAAPFLYNVLRKIRNRLPNRLPMRNEVAEVHHKNPLDRVRQTALADILPTDWSRTLACATMMGNCGFVHLNVKGRQPKGIVNPGDEYEALRNQIINRLKTIRDPIEGDPVFEEIYKPDDIYPGYDPKKAPDIILVPKGGYYVSLICPGDKHIEVSEYTNVSGRMVRNMGTHRPEGFFIFKGYQFQKIWMGMYSRKL